jgi:hypothetical protein
MQMGRLTRPAPRRRSECAGSRRVCPPSTDRHPVVVKLGVSVCRSSFLTGPADLWRSRPARPTCSSPR